MASANDFTEVYENLGINTGRLGCIMADVEPITVSDVIPEDALHVKDEDPDYVKGYVSEQTPHVTLLFGLLRSGQEMQKHVDAVLNVEGRGYPEDRYMMPGEIVIDHVDFFYAKDPADKYVTIVAHIKVTAELLEANARLRLLPHIDTFPEYNPHISLAYVKDSSDWNDYILRLNERLAGTVVRVVGLNYGD